MAEALGPCTRWALLGVITRGWCSLSGGAGGERCWGVPTVPCRQALATAGVFWELTALLAAPLLLPQTVPSP